MSENPKLPTTQLANLPSALLAEKAFGVAVVGWALALELRVYSRV